MWRAKVAKVSGTSMLPEFKASDYVVALRWFWSTFNPGDVVLVLHSSLGLIIKRVLIVRSNLYQLAGDHPSSVSSEAIGWVERRQIVGRIVCRISNPLPS